VLAAAHRRKERNLISGVERRAPRSKFLIARGDQRSAEPRKLRMTLTIASEKRFDRRAVGKFDGVLGVADDIFEPAEEKHLDARSLGSDAHKRIVSCGRGPGHSLRS